MRVLPGLLQDRLDEELQRNSVTLGEHTKALILGVFQDCHMELFNGYRKRNSQSNSKSDTDSEIPIGEPQNAPQQASADNFQKMDQWNGSPTDVGSVSGWRNNALVSDFSTPVTPEKDDQDYLAGSQMQWASPKIPELSLESSAPFYGQDASALGMLPWLNPLYPFN